MTNNSDEITLLIADDHAMTRKGIEIIAKYEWHIKDISSVSSIAETKNIIDKKSFSHLILDVSFGDGNSIEIIDQILHKQPQISILIFTMHPKHILDGFLSTKGIKWVVQKDLPEEKITEILRTFLFEHNSGNLNIDSMNKFELFHMLSQRELQILQLMIKGVKTNEIAIELDVKNNTISTLKNRLLQKVGITNEIELIEIGKMLGIDKINQIENE
jgi:hypothetical protein